MVVCWYLYDSLRYDRFCSTLMIFDLTNVIVVLLCEAAGRVEVLRWLWDQWSDRKRPHTEGDDHTALRQDHLSAGNLHTSVVCSSPSFLNASQPWTADWGPAVCCYHSVSLFSYQLWWSSPELCVAHVGRDDSLVGSDEAWRMCLCFREQRSLISQSSMILPCLTWRPWTRESPSPNTSAISGERRGACSTLGC